MGGRAGARLRPACWCRFWFSRPNSRISRITHVKKIDERVGGRRRSMEQTPSAPANVRVTGTSETSPAHVPGTFSCGVGATAPRHPPEGVRPAGSGMAGHGTRQPGGHGQSVSGPALGGGSRVGP